MVVTQIIFHTGKNNHSNRNPSCKHYYEVYSDPELPPSWMIVEVLPMGTWSRVYENIEKGKVRQKVSKFFSFKTNDFAGWLHAFLSSFTRNATWSKKLHTLLQECSLDIHYHMDFPADWDQIPFWRIFYTKQKNGRKAKRLISRKYE